jgi:hypothetical protein
MRDADAIKLTQARGRSRAGNRLRGAICGKFSGGHDRIATLTFRKAAR